MTIRTTTVAASLFAIIVFFAFGALAANQDVVFQTTFNPNTPLLGNLRIHLQNDSISPLFIFGQDINGKKKPLIFDKNGRDIIVNPSPLPFEIINLTFAYSLNHRNDNIDRSTIYENNSRVNGDWSLPQILVTGTLINVTDSLSIRQVAVADTHLVAFTTTTTAIGDSGEIWIAFPLGFNLSNVDSVIYSDNDVSNDSPEDTPRIVKISTNDHSLIFQFDKSGQQAIPGSRIRLKFWTIGSDTIAQSYSVAVMTTDSTGEIMNDVVYSDPFDLDPGPPAFVDIHPDTAMTLQSGSLVNFSASARDQYNNPVPNQNFTFHVMVDSCGDISSGGAFIARKLGTTVISVTDQGITDYSGLITVIPGPLDHFDVSGFPAGIIAGTPFPNPITVEAFDLEGNRKWDYLGYLYFATGDTLADLPYRINSPYQFRSSDSGRVSFSGSGFILRTASNPGSTNIQITNGSIGVYSPPIRVSAAAINHFRLVTGFSHVAGDTFSVFVDLARDAYGNLASGDVVISDSIGAGNSPDGIPPIFHNISVTNGTGHSPQTLTRAGDGIVLKGVANGNVRAATDPFLVLPGTLSHFDLSGYPDFLDAGGTFPRVTVDAVDIFGNYKTDYNGLIYFESTDPQAVLPYIQSNPVNLLGGDSTFAGSRFSLRTAGRQSITVTDGNLFTESNLITVNPAAISQFVLDAPINVNAGSPFIVSAREARDIWGNSANGTIVISAIIGGDSSPNGTQPVFSPITVVADSGSAQQTLYNVNNTVLGGASDTITSVTDTIAVGPGQLGSFNLIIATPQVAGVPFRGPSSLTALDRYGNLKTNFDVSTDSVVIAATSGGQMANNILNALGDFVQGLANLETKGTTYRGSGGLMSFQAVSESGANGLSNQVDMNAIRCTGLNIEETAIAQGDTANGTISVSNIAGRNVTINNLYVIDGVSWITDPIFDAAFPTTLNPGESRTFSFALPILDTLTVGMRRLTGAAHGAYGLVNVTDTLLGFADSLLIQSRSSLSYIAGTLQPDTLSSGLSYALSVRLRNDGVAALALFDSSYLSFTDGSILVRTSLPSPAYLTPGNPVLINFESTLIPLDFIPGTYPTTFHYFGTENGSFRMGQVPISDMILIQSGSVLTFAGNLNIDSLVGGQNAAFSFQIHNNGQADFIVTHQTTRFSFSDSQRQYISFSDTASGVRIDTLHSGVTTFHFSSAQLPANFDVGYYHPNVIISGTHNGHNAAFSFTIDSDSVKVISRAQIRIDSTYVISRNAPFVNISQPCSLKTIITNLGDETVNSFYIHLTTTGGSTFPDSILIANLGGHETLPVLFHITAGGTSNSNEIFSSRISGGIGSMSGDPAQILAPLDNSSLLITETPAELAISNITIIGPPGALDSSISVGQTVIVLVTVSNLGEAGISGLNQLTLYPGNAGWVVDTLQRNYAIGLPVNWQLVASSNPSDSAGFSIGISGSPIDINDGTNAIGPNSVSLIWFVIENRASIDQTASITSPDGAIDGTISTDQIIVIRDILSPHGLYRNKAARLSLPDDFTTQDSLVKYPSGDTVIWHLRAPSLAITDTAIVTSWIYDLNRGDSSDAQQVDIPITVINAARLQLTTAISGPPSALDGIVEPGSRIVFEAIVRNLGTAGVSTGQLLLHLGNPDVSTSDGTLRDFTVGVPVSWTLNMPASEVTLPIPIWVTIDSDPTEENTNLPALIIVDSSGASVVVRELYPRLILTNISGHSGSAVKGLPISYVTFDLENRDIGGNFQIGITAFRFNIQSTPQVLASDIFSTASVTSDSRTLNVDNLNGSTITFTTTDTIALVPQTNLRFTLNLTLKSEINIRDFSVGFGNDVISAVVFENYTPTEQLNAVSSRGEPISWQGEPTAILEPSFTASISSYPNPFGPQDGGTKIGYYLPAAADLEIRIFTLLGELVWTKSVSSAETFGTAGLHTGSTALTWNGTNDLGSSIRSGVYICMVKNLTTGEEAKFKIAVVK